MGNSYNDFMKQIVSDIKSAEREADVVSADDLVIDAETEKDIIDDALKDKIIDTSIDNIDNNDFDDSDEDESSDSSNSENDDEILPTVSFTKVDNHHIAIDFDNISEEITDEIVDLLNKRKKFQGKLGRIIIRNGIKFRPKSRSTGASSTTSKKNNINYEEVAKDFVENFDKMSSFAKYESILILCKESAASSAKKLGISPANRISKAAKCESPISNKDGLRDKVVEFYKNHSEMAKYPAVRELISESLFNTKIYN